MNFGVWQIVYICLIVFAVGATMAKHGEPKEGNHNAIVTLFPQQSKSLSWQQVDFSVSK